MREYAVGDEPVPGYQITRPLGAGGYGTVWVAKSPGDVEIALKIINLQGQGLKEFRAISLVKRLRHPNLIPIYAFWLKDEYGNFLDSTAQDSVNLRGRQSDLIIAMGLGEMSLVQRLEECKKEFSTRHGLADTDAALLLKLNELNGSDFAGIPAEELLEYMFGAAKAIDYLNQPTHNLGAGPTASIQHCDIKPGNLLIVGNEVQVCDYGLARALTADARKTAAAGTPAYMAPELIAGKPSVGTDQYSLAISFYELRTGRLPFEEALAFHAHITGQLDFSLVSQGEQEILKRSTQSRPDTRYPHTIEMVRALRDMITPSKQPTPMSFPSVPPVSGTGVHRSAGGSGPAVASSSTPTITSKPTVLDDLIQKGVELVPGHRLERLVGRGGYGEVWEAKMPGNTRCALKIVRNLDAMQGKQELKSLDLIRELEHDRLIRLQAYWLLAGDGSVIPDEQIGAPGAPKTSALVVATDLAAMNLLQKWQECYDQGNAGIPVRDLVLYVRQSAEAIDHLNQQEQPIVHRDIKPENILLTKNGHVKVSDFGLAKIVEGGGIINAASVGMTLAYAAPELFKNRVTRWTDQYSLAVTYYRLRVGRLPFEEGLGPIQMMQAHADGRLEFTGVGADEQEVLKRACTVEPERRYPDCVAFAEALAAAVGMSRPVVSTPAMQMTHPASAAAVATGSGSGPHRTSGSGPPPIPASGVRATARFPTPTPGSTPSNVRETLRFEDVQSPPMDPRATPQMPGRPPVSRPMHPSSDEFHLPGEPQRSMESPRAASRPVSLPAGFTETTTNIPSAERDTDPQPQRADWRQSRAPVAAGRGGNKGVIIGAAAAGLLLVAGGIYVVATRDWSSNPTTPTQVEDPKAKLDKLRADTESKVAELIGRGDYAAAAKAVRDAVAEKAGESWGAKQDSSILTAWRQFAEGAKSDNEKLATFQDLLKTYPNDTTSKERVGVITFVVKNQHAAELFKEALGKLRNAAFAGARATVEESKKELDRLSKEAGPEEAKQIAVIRQAGDEVSAALDDLEKSNGTPASEKLIAELAKKVSATKPTGEQEYKLAVREAYRRVLSDKIEQIVPELGSATKWGDLLAACKAAMPVDATAANGWVAACRAECVAELLHRQQAVGQGDERVAPTTPSGASPKLAAYCQYASAIYQWTTTSGAKAAADALAALVPEKGEQAAAHLSAYRCARALADLRFSAGMVRGTNAMAPFQDAGDGPAKWLAAAVRLADRDAKTPPADKLRLKFDLALAHLAKQPADVEHARPLTDEIVPDAAQKVWAPAVIERVLAWLAYARARDASQTGRQAAARGYCKLLEELRDDLAEVRADFLFANLVRPLDTDGGKSILGDKPEAFRTDAGRLYFLAGRNVRRYADAWNDVDLGQNRDRERRQLSVRLFERAAELDKSSDYVAWAGIAKSELPGADPAKLLPTGTGSTADTPAMCLLRGIISIAQAEPLKDLAQRVAKWREADSQFQTGLSLCATRPEFSNERVLLYERAAKNCIQLANAVGKAKADEMSTYLNHAKKYADELLELDKGRIEVYDTRGCAIEDMAWLREDPDRSGKNGKYAQAVADFTKAIGGFGVRATPWMHRGRCRFKWAEDEFRTRGVAGLDEALLAAAETDLNQVFTLAAGTMEAAEAYFWKGRVALLRKDLPMANPAELYSQAADSFRQSAAIAKSLHIAEWAETALMQWAFAAYEEALRLAPERNQPARVALADALSRAEAVKEFSPPYATNTIMRLQAEVRKKLEPTRDCIPDALAASKEGLDPNCRAQDKPLQFLIRLLLVDYRTSIVNSNSQHVDAEKALADAQAAMKLVSEAGLTEADKAQALGAEGIAYFFIHTKNNSPDDLKRFRDSFQEAVRIAPDHPNAWKWKACLGYHKAVHERTKAVPEDATRLAQAYRLFREAESTNPVRSEEEKAYQKVMIRPQREGAEKVGFPIWVEQIKDAPNNADRPTWLLAAAEKLALAKDDTKKAKQYFEDARKAVADLPESQREAYRRQIERVDKLLK